MVLQGGTAVVNVVANGAALASSISGAVTSATQRVGRSMQSTGLAMTKFLTVPLAALGVVSTKMALDFETTFSRIEALAGDIGVTTEEAKERVKALAQATGQDPGGLAEALYFTASAGLAVKDVFPVLKASAQAAATGMGTASDNAKLLTTVLHDYEGTGLSAANAMNILTEAIKVGKAEPADFAENIGVVIPLASQLGVSFQDVAAAIAQASNAGVEVSRGVTGLRFLLAALQNPTEESKKTFEDYGISLQNLQARLQESGGLLSVMQDLAKTFDLTSVSGKAAWGTITGGARGAVIANTLVGNSAESARELWEKLGLSAKDTATQFQDAFAIMKQTPQFKFQQALTSLKETAIDLGLILIPILRKDVIPAIRDVMKFFQNLGDGTKGLIVKIGLLAAAFGPLLVVFGSIIRLGGSVVSTLAKVAGAASGAGGAGAGSTISAIGTGFASAAVGVGAFAVAAKQGFDQLQRFKEGDFEGFINGVANAWEIWGGMMTGISQDVGRVGTSLNVSQEAIQGWADQLAQGTITAQQLTTELLKTGASSEEVASIIDQVTAATEDASLSSVKWLDTLFRSQDVTKKQAEKMSALVEGFKNLGGTLTGTDKQMVNNLIAMGDFSGAMKLLRDRLKELTRPWTVKVKTEAETAALDALRTKMLGLGFRSTSDGWVASAAMVVHTRPGSPWPWEVIEKGLKSIGFTKRTGGGGDGDAAFFMKTIVQVHADFSNVQRRLETLLPLIREAAGEGAADQARAFARDLKGLEKQFDRLKTKALDFRDAIKGAFSDAADLIGTIGSALSQFASDQAQFLEAQAQFQEGGGIGEAPVAPQAVDISALIRTQVASAQQLASLLKKLQEQGLNVANLSQLAGQGAGAIPIAEALLQDPALIQQLNNAQQQIAEITQQTADKMTQAAFGDKLLNMSHALDTLLERLNHFLDGLRPEKINDKNKEFVDALDHLIHAINNATGRIGSGGGGGNDNVTVNVSGGSEQTGRDVRDALLQLKRRNLTTGL